MNEKQPPYPSNGIPSMPPLPPPPPPVTEFDLTEPEPVLVEQVPAEVPSVNPVLGRRMAVQRFNAPQKPESSAPLRRDLLRSGRKTSDPEIGRQRKIAGSLPEWEPIPPGEIFSVRRSS